MNKGEHLFSGYGGEASLDESSIYTDGSDKEAFQKHKGDRLTFQGSGQTDVPNIVPTNISSSSSTFSPSNSPIHFGQDFKHPTEAFTDPNHVEPKEKPTKKHHQEPPGVRLGRRASDVAIGKANPSALLLDLLRRIDAADKTFESRARAVQELFDLFTSDPSSWEGKESEILAVLEKALELLKKSEDSDSEPQDAANKKHKVNHPRNQDHSHEPSLRGDGSATAYADLLFRADKKRDPDGLHGKEWYKSKFEIQPPSDRDKSDRDKNDDDEDGNDDFSLDSSLSDSAVHEWGQIPNDSLDLIAKRFEVSTTQQNSSRETLPLSDAASRPRWTLRRLFGGRSQSRKGSLLSGRQTLSYDSFAPSVEWDLSGTKSRGSVSPQV